MTHLAERVHELHRGPMKGLDIVGSTIVTGGADAAIRVLDTNGEHGGTSTAHHDLVNSVAIGPSGRVASGSRDRAVRVFDPAVGRSYVIGEHDHWVMAVAWSDDGQRVVSASEDGSIGLWDPEGASVTRTAVGSPVNGVDWRADTIVAVTGRGALLVLDPDGTMRREHHEARSIQWDVALSPDGTRAAWVGRDRLLRITDLRSGATDSVLAHDAQIWSVRWSESGDRIVTGSADGTARIWGEDGTPLERITVGSWVRGAVLRGVELYLATEDGHLRIFSSDGLDAAPPPAITTDDPPQRCEHWEPQVLDAGSRPRCAECGSPEEARLCVTCGHKGCCESQLAHATKHWLETGHPNTVPAPVRESGWRWCYADDIYVKRG